MAVAVPVLGTVPAPCAGAAVPEGAGVRHKRSCSEGEDAKPIPGVGGGSSALCPHLGAALAAPGQK